MVQRFRTEISNEIKAESVFFILSKQNIFYKFEKYETKIRKNENGLVAIQVL